MQEYNANSLPTLDENLEISEPAEAGMLPIDGLPKEARDIIKHYERSLQCPRDYLTASVLSAFSWAFGSIWRITDGNYNQYGNLYMALVGDAGAGKSKPISKIFEPIEEMERLSMEDYERRLMEELSKPADQRRKVHPIEHILQNSTPEATTEALKYNQLGVIQYSDELSSFLTGRGMYNGNFDSGELNTMFDGNCSIKRSRKTEGVTYAPKCYYNIIGGIQPQIITRKFNEDDLINGFLFRFLFVYPDNMRKEYKSNYSQQKPEVIDEWKKFIMSVRSNDPFCDVRDVRFSPEALKVVTDFHNRNAVDKYNDTTQSSEKSIYAKSTQQLYKLVLITALANNHMPATKKDAEYAVRCMEYFIKCAFKVQNLFTSDSQTKKMSNQDALKIFCEQFQIDGNAYKDTSGRDIDVIDCLAKATNKSKETIRTMIRRCGFTTKEEYHG